MRFQPSVKLKIDMLKTSKGSWPGARRRKRSRTLFLKLFSRCLAFIVYPKILDAVPFLATKRWRDFAVPLSREDVSVAESAGACYSCGLTQVRRSPNDSLYEIQFESASFRLD